MSEAPQFGQQPAAANLSGGGEDYLRPRTPEDFNQHAVESMLAIAGVEAGVLGQAPAAESSLMTVDPANRATTMTSPPLTGWAVTFENKRDLPTGRDKQVVTVRHDPPMPDSFDDDLTATQAAVLWSGYEAEKARAPRYVWDELGGHTVAREQDGISVPISELPIDDLVEAKETLRTAAIITALARQRDDVVRQLTRHEAE